MTELWRYGAGELAAMIARGEASSREVVDAHLQRIAAVNPTLNAITHVLDDEARVAAAEADRAVAARRLLGPLHGVPVTIKQNIDQVGCATNWGLPALAEAFPPVDSPIVERIRAAGAIPLGRTNCPDMGLRMHTDSSLFGLTRNPWRLSCTPGGSSGGEGAALASGMSPVGFGNDLGGSLRNPATCCGIASLKPSAGRVPMCTLIPSVDGPASFQLMPVEGPMARRIADVRLGLSIIAGRHPRDPYSVPAPLDSPRVPGRPLRVAVLANPPGGATDPRLAACTQTAATALSSAGYEVVDVEPPRFKEVIATWRALIGADLRLLRPTIQPLMSVSASRFMDYFLESETPLDLAGYVALLMTRQSLIRDWQVWFTSIDLVLTPAWTQLPFSSGWDAATRENTLATMELIRCVMMANLLGLPSACVSAGRVDGLPVGVLLTGDRFADDKTLDAAEIIERAIGVTTPIDPASS